MISNDATIQEIVRLQQQLAAVCPLQPILGKDTNLPHMTLLQGRFSDLAKVYQSIHDLRNYWEQKYLQQPEVFSFDWLKCVYKPPGWYFLQPHPHTIGDVGHQFCFNALKDTMILLDSECQKDMFGYTPSEALNYQKYGYRYIGQDFYPHFTLGQTGDRLNSIALDTWMKLVPTQQLNISGRFVRLTLYRVGSYGSHRESLIDLKIDI
ncbi:MAG: hypothetical protein F6K16_11500 [Symploca sp. SIO2B6]|nr:hypothetical protein [Symploca sp. SIO2B6]